jgi:hypothetical protein
VSNANPGDVEFELLLEQAVIANFYEELDSLPPREELAKMYTTTPEYDERMRKVFLREYRKDFYAKMLKICKRTVAAVLIIVTVLFGMLMFNPVVRATVVETIISWYQEFVRFTSPAAEHEEHSKEPAFVPSGFWEEYRIDRYYIVTIYYLNPAGDLIIFEALRAGGTLAVDGTDIEYSVVIDNGIEFHIFISTDELTGNFVVWEADGWRYRLYSTVSVEYLQEMAMSLG